MADEPQLPAITPDASFVHGGIVRGPTVSRQIALLFTGHEFAESATRILDELASRGVKASFFLTGGFLANPEFAPLVRRMIREGHYVGPHSDKHLLYCSWDSSRKTLVTKEKFIEDLESNLAKLRNFGISRTAVRWFVPPYEHYNDQVAGWSNKLGLQLINFTPGTRSTADYTGEADTNFVSSEAVFRSISARHRADASGLNGYLLLLHVGAGPGRADKFHARFGELLDFLRGQGYALVSVDTLLSS